MTRIVIAEHSAAAGEFAADLVVEQLQRTSTPTLGVATGSTPLPIWAALSRRRIPMGGVTVFALDEYLGLAPGHPQSYRAVIEREIIGPLGIDPGRAFTPRTTGDHELAARDYEAQIRAVGGVDVQVLGIGRNGHIGFNEPGSSLAGSTRVVTLSEETRRDNARFFADAREVPTHSITQGVGTILRARQLVLVAFGRHKASAVARAVEGAVSTATPASALQLHSDAWVVLDPDASAELTFARDSALRLER
ncbi:MAG: glucosamine-6-phosphate deaminase [Microcella sp.]|uniref:glucosamine-6-phosphate deaminase n=1 Tax=Microcella sp. TaxID=1913979 RepID=UPI0024CB57ED|nr:glucosamine-6-phosphate deaminase [Microcella sp.]UYN83228.1 MAG: glucosamine-6-phosphate deaminase [Microcella sp.]